MPADTFFDEEDHDAREMELRLLTGNRQSVPLTSWLQFEPKNQEFIGLPMDQHVGRSHYHLVSLPLPSASRPTTTWLVYRYYPHYDPLPPGQATATTRLLTHYHPLNPRPVAV